MKGRLLLVLSLALVIVLLVATGASAVSWYAGNYRTTAYGARADISTPSSAPFVGSSGEANYVSTPGPTYWLQTGWRYYSGYTTAKPYYEVSVPNLYELVEYSSQSWGTTINYQLNYAGSGYWTVSIGGVSQGSYGPLSGPVSRVYGESETHYSTVQMNTQFNNVQYRGASSWYYFDQSNWFTNSPYYLTITSTYKYKTLGP